MGFADTLKDLANKAGEIAGKVGERAGEIGQQVGEKVGDITHQVSEKVGDISQQVGEKVNEIRGDHESNDENSAETPAESGDQAAAFTAENSTVNDINPAAAQSSDLGFENSDNQAFDEERDIAQNPENN